MFKSIPKRIRAGDSASWEVELVDYPATDGWVLSYTLVRANHIYTNLISVSTVGDAFQASIPFSATASITPGSYTLYGTVTKGTERHTIITKKITVEPSVNTAHDNRSQAERTLQAIRDLLEGKASDDHQMIQYAGRTLSRYTFEQLRDIESKLARTVARERDRRAGRSGRIGVIIR